MRNAQSGFTLIELVVVIVILGILAAVAIPKFVDLSSEAELAAVQGMAGGMSSAMAINYAGCAAKNNVAGAKCVAVDDCADVASVLTTPVGNYTITGGAIAAPAGTTNALCTVTKTGGTAAATFTGIRAGI